MFIWFIYQHFVYTRIERFDVYDSNVEFFYNKHALIEDNSNRKGFFDRYKKRHFYNKIQSLFL